MFMSKGNTHKNRREQNVKIVFPDFSVDPSDGATIMATPFAMATPCAGVIS